MPESETQILAEKIANAARGHEAYSVATVLALALADSIQVLVTEDNPDLDDAAKLRACVAVWDHLTKGMYRSFAGEGGPPMFRSDAQ